MGKNLKGKEIGKGFIQRKDGVYCVRYTNNFGKRVSLYNSDLRELKREYAKVAYEMSSGIAVVNDKITLNEWFKLWLFSYKVNCIRENTKRQYSQIFYKHISPYIGDIELINITKLQCVQLLNELKDNGLQWETQNKVKLLITDMYHRAMEDNFARRNPMEGVRLPSNKPQNERRVLTRSEQALFFECCAGTFYNNLFIVAVNTGLRPGELFALTWDDIDFKNKLINIDKTLVYQKYLDDTKKEFHLEQPKTKTSNRKVPITSECETALKRQYMQKSVISHRKIKESAFSDRLFTTKFNTPLNAQLYNDAINNILKEINLMLDPMEQIMPFTGHTFRHTFATRCLESGIDTKVLQKYMGHATLQMTVDLYVHVTNDFKQQEAMKLNDSMKDIKISDEDIENGYIKVKEKENKVIPIVINQ